MKRSLFLLAIVFALCFVANAQQPSTPDDSSIDNGVYNNRFFGFSVTYPKDWVVHGDATNTRLKEIGKERAATTGAMSSASAEVILRNTYQLLTAFQYPLGAAHVEMNPSFMIVAENVSHAPGISDGYDYLVHVRPMMIKTGVIPIQDEPAAVMLSGCKFFRQDSRIQVNGTSVQQAIVMTVINGYALAFILSGKDQQSVDELVEALGTLKFDTPPIRRGITTVLGTFSSGAAPSTSSPQKPKPSPRSPQNKSKTRPRP